MNFFEWKLRVRGSMQRALRSVTTVAVIATAGLTLAACDSEGVTGRVQENELIRAEQRWVASGLSGVRYTMRQQRICFCGDYMITWDVTVSGGVPVRVVSPTGLDLPASMYSGFRSVEQMFAEVRSGLDNGVVKEVAYDAATGYPAVLSLDPKAAVADDEVLYRTSSVTRAP